MSLPKHQQLPECPACGGPSVPSERAMRGDERPRGQLGCMCCGITWKGTPKQLEKAWEAERSWETKERRDELRAKHTKKLSSLREKLERLKEGRW